MPKKLFDLHLEVGETDIAGVYYAKTIFGKGTWLFEKTNNYIDDALCELVCEMAAVGAWKMLALNPSLAQFPFGSFAPPNTNKAAVPKSPSTKSTKNTQRRQWSDLTNVPKGQCEDQCIVYDNFAGKKCGSFCSHKK